jgi:heme exporter protein A
VNLVVENLVVIRGMRTVIDGVSLALAKGEALLLTGPNGAGKTTLLRTIAGFLLPERGAIRLEGAEPERSLAEHCHYVGHLNGIKPALTVGENLAFWAAYLAGGASAAEQARLIQNALEQLDLEALADIPAAYLSAGQKRRVGLARLMLARRAVWLLDEPTVSLDAQSTAAVSSLIETHLSAGGLALIATHMPIGLQTFCELNLGIGARAGDGERRQP